MITRLAAHVDTSNHYFVNVTTGGFGAVLSDANGSLAYLAGLLNSRLLDWFLKNGSTTFHGGYFAANKQFLDQLPIEWPRPNDNRSRHVRLVSLVTLMLDLHVRQAAAKTPAEQNALARQIAHTDQQIDALVYELYGLTDDEIRIVEEATK